MATSTTKLAKLEKIDDIRQIWPHEASYFTKWLCEEENLINLSDEIGISIALDESESNVGEYRADIIAHEEGTGRRIIIENQLEETNHDHLGKLITYASGKEAAVIIWIVKKARDEHRRAIEWLNERTDQNVGFFLLEIEVWKIGDSDPAAKFNVVERPNDWAKDQKVLEAMTSGEQLAFRFWTAFCEYASKKSEMTKAFKFKKPQKYAWYEFSSGVVGLGVELSFRTKKKCLQAGIYFHDCKDIFNNFQEHKEEIVELLGKGIVWNEAKKDCRIYAENSVDPGNEASWDKLFDWLCDMSLRLKKIAMQYGK